MEILFQFFTARPLRPLLGNCFFWESRKCAAAAKVRHFCACPGVLWAFDWYWTGLTTMLCSVGLTVLALARK